MGLSNSMGVMRVALAIALAGLPLWAALSDPQASARANALWGPIGAIGHGARRYTDTYWRHHVGVWSEGCHDDFTVLGVALNTWDLAFAAVPADAVKGPYSGTISLMAEVHEETTALREFQFRLDGNALMPPITEGSDTRHWSVSKAWDTSTVPDGVHSLCWTATDTPGNVGRGHAMVIRIDQAKPSIYNGIHVLQ